MENAGGIYHLRLISFISSCIRNVSRPLEYPANSQRFIRRRIAVGDASNNRGVRLVKTKCFCLKKKKNEKSFSEKC